MPKEKAQSMPDQSEDRAAWVQRVLGVAIPRAGASEGLLARWTDARQQAHDAVVDIGRALLDLPEVQGDPRFGRVQKAVAGLPGLIPEFADGDLSAATVAAWQAQLGKASTLSDLEQFAQSNLGDFPPYSILEEALAGIATALPA
jgi:hypothetical protein